MEAARYLADNITDHINQELEKQGKEPVQVWPYSIYYPYYEQYITMADDALVQIGMFLYRKLLIICIAVVIFNLTRTEPVQSA